MIENHLKELIKEYPNFPKDGILFKDLVPILTNPEVYKLLIEKMANSSICQFAENVIAIDARGFLFASAVGLSIGKPVILARKPGKLPGKLIEESYELEYGSATLEMQEGEGEVVIVDDVLATGGTLQATNDLAKQAGYTVVGNLVLVDLEYVPRVDNFNLDVRSVIQYG